MTESPSSSAVAPEEQVRVSLVPGEVGVIEAELTVGGVLPTVTVGLETGLPESVPSLGVAVQRTVSFRLNALLLRVGVVKDTVALLTVQT